MKHLTIDLHVVKEGTEINKKRLIMTETYFQDHPEEAFETLFNALSSIVIHLLTNQKEE